MRARLSKKTVLGFSLIEVVVVLGLVAAVLGMVAALAEQTLVTLSFLREKAESSQSATLGCERLCSELSESISIPAISAGTGVTFFKANPNAPDVLGNDPDSDTPHLWARDYTGGNRVQVSYLTNGSQELERRANGGPANLVAVRVNDLTVAQMGTSKSFEVRLSILERRRLVVFVNIVHCPGVPI